MLSVVRQQRPLSYAVRESRPEWRPMSHASEADLIIFMRIRARVEHRKKDFSGRAAVSLDFCSRPQQVTQTLGRGNFHSFELIKWQPGIIVMDDHFQKWSQEIIAITEGGKWLSI